VQVKVSARHGHLSEAVQRSIRDRAEKLLHYFDRITLIEVTLDLQKTPDDRCRCEFVVQAEHKHDFVATESHQELLGAVDLAMTKIEGQLRRYKEKIQDHRRTPPVGDLSDGARQDFEE